MVELYKWEWDGGTSFTNHMLVNSFNDFGLGDYRNSIVIGFPLESAIPEPAS